MSDPAILRHNAILGAWHEYPEGSVERAKSLGIKLKSVFTRVDVTMRHWDTVVDIVWRDESWKALGLSSWESMCKEITGKPPVVVRFDKVAPDDEKLEVPANDYEEAIAMVNAYYGVSKWLGNQPEGETE